MKLNPNLDGLVGEGDTFLKALLEKAYERGAADMHALIMNTASQVVVASPAKPSPKAMNGSAGTTAKPVKATKSKKKRTSKASERAPRGSIDKALNDALYKKPGLTVKDYEVMAIKAEPRISITSIGNTLRRLKGTKYRNEGDRWFLMDN